MTMTADHIQTAPAELGSFPTPQSRPRVLLVEDNATTAVLVSAVLSTQGFEVEVYSDPDNAQAAMASPNASAFDAYVLDWRLGAKTSASLLRALLDPAAFGAATPAVVLMSGDVSDDGRTPEPWLDDMVSSSRLVARPKPYSPLSLAKELRAMLLRRSH